MHSCDFDCYHQEEQQKQKYDLLFCQACWFNTVTVGENNTLSDCTDTCMFCVQHMLKNADTLTHQTYVSSNDLYKIMLKFDDRRHEFREVYPGTFEDGQYVSIKEVRNLLLMLDENMVKFLKEKSMKFW
jgi:hypothetical protein